MRAAASAIGATAAGLVEAVSGTGQPLSAALGVPSLRFLNLRYPFKGAEPLDLELKLLNLRPNFVSGNFDLRCRTHESPHGLLSHRIRGWMWKIVGLL
jgi:hypothetical protein